MSKAIHFPSPPHRPPSSVQEGAATDPSFIAFSSSPSGDEETKTAATATAASPRRGFSKPFGRRATPKLLLKKATANGDENLVPPSPPPNVPLPPTPKDTASSITNGSIGHDSDGNSVDGTTVLGSPSSSYRSKRAIKHHRSTTPDLPKVTFDVGEAQRSSNGHLIVVPHRSSSTNLKKDSEHSKDAGFHADDDVIHFVQPNSADQTGATLQPEGTGESHESPRPSFTSAMERTLSEQSILSNNKSSSPGKMNNKADSNRGVAPVKEMPSGTTEASDGGQVTRPTNNESRRPLSKEQSSGMVRAAAPPVDNGAEGNRSGEDSRLPEHEYEEDEAREDDQLDSDEYAYSDDGDTAQPHGQESVPAPYAGVRYKTKRFDDYEGDGVGLGVMTTQQQPSRNGGVPKWLSEEPQFTHGSRPSRHDSRTSANDSNRRTKGGLRAAAGFVGSQGALAHTDYADDVMSPGLETGPPSTRGFKALRHGAPTNDSRSTLGQEPMSRNPSHTNVYRKSGLRSDLADWAPSAKPNPHINDPAFASHNLPEWSSLRAGDPTSKPISRIRRDLDWSMRRLMSEDTFEKLIGDPLGRYHFRQFLVQQTGTENKLDLYFDVCQYAKQTEAVRSASDALHDVYLALDSESHVDLPENLAFDFYSTLRKQYELKTTVAPLQRHLLQSLYRGEFQNFVKAKLVEHNKVRLGTLMDDSAGGTSASGLGDCFCLTNPRLRENPIVLVSPGFTALTGYPATSIIGRNCRFLSGPGTAPNSIQRIRDALNAGSSCTELLLNYKRDGQPFFNLLTILPLRDATGNLVYFIGGQTEVTSQLASSKGLSWLLGGGDDVLPVSVTAAAQHNTINGVEVSPQMARYLQEADRMKGFASHEDDASDDGFSMAGGSSFRGDGDFDGPSLARPRMPANRQRSHRTKATAAGYYDPNASSGPAADQMVLDLAPSSSSSSSRRSDAGGATSSVGLISRLFGGGGSKKSKGGNQKQISSGGDQQGLQRLAGAEQLFQRDPHSLEDQMDFFSNLYSKLIIFKRAKREVVFVTRAAITYFNLPTTTWYDVHSSPLVHADLLSLLRGSDKAETKSIRAAVQEAIRQGTHISIQTAVRTPPTSRRNAILDKVAEFGNTNGKTPVDANGEPLRFTTMHITPLKDRENASFAFVAVVA